MNTSSFEQLLDGCRDELNKTAALAVNPGHLYIQVINNLKDEAVYAYNKKQYGEYPDSTKSSRKIQGNLMNKGVNQKEFYYHRQIRSKICYHISVFQGAIYFAFAVLGMAIIFTSGMIYATYKMNLNMPPLKKDEGIVEEQYMITVQSYEDYQNTMLKLPYNSNVALTISLQTKSDWPINAKTGNAYMVSSLNLEGNMNITTLVNILKGMHKLKYLKITNSSQLLCDYDTGTTLFYERKINLPSLQQLVLEGIKECPTFYKIVSNNILLNELKRFQVNSCIVDKTNVAFIQKILKSSRFSLTAIELPDTQVQASLFDESLGMLPAINYLHLDFINNDGSILFMDEYINEYLPNLKELYSDIGFLLIDRLFYFKNCRKLTSITIGLYIPPTQLIVDLIQIHQSFPFLKKLDLSIYFANNKGCMVTGAYDVDMFFEELKFRDNCQP